MPRAEVRSLRSPRKTERASDISSCRFLIIYAVRGAGPFFISLMTRCLFSVRCSAADKG